MNWKNKIDSLERWKLLGFSLVPPYLAALVGTFFTQTTVNSWYPTLAKPGFTPPNWVFGPVWTVLYTLMGVSLYLVLKKNKLEEVKKPVSIFGLQLLLNAAWSGAFFTLKSPLAGMTVIIPLWFVIAWNIYEFDKVSRNAALLLIPYLIWVSFALVLNYSIWMMN